MIRIGILFFFFCLVSCRTIQKASSRAETANRDTSSVKYNREIITEYVVRDTSTGKPVIVNVMPGQPGNSQTQAPVVITQKEPYIIRQTIRESGEAAQSNTQSTQTESNEKQASMPMLLQISIAVFAGSFLLIALAALIFLIKK